MSGLLPRSNASLIREWMKANEGDQSADAIAEGTGIDRKTVTTTMGDMRRLGHVVSVPVCYRLTGVKIFERPRTEAERTARAKAIRKRQNLKRRPRDAEGVPLSVAARKAAADERRKERDRLRDERARVATDKLKAADRNAKAKAKKHQAALAVMAKDAERRNEAKPPAPDRPAMTSDDFIAQGGKVQKLSNGEMATPLRFIGHRSSNEASWRRTA